MGRGSDGRPVIRPTGARDTAETPWRSDYVRHQQEVARHALFLGFAGAARAALLGLSADDFLDPATAGEYFEVLRDRSARDAQVLAAIHGLMSLAPAPPLAEDKHRFIAYRASVSGRPQSETD